MQKKFHQYNLITELAKKYSHSTYLASPINSQGGHSEPEHQVVLTVFASSLFRFPHDFSLFLEVIQSILSPSPTFPLARSTHSRSNGTASHPTQSAKAKIISSPTRRRVVNRPAETALSSIRKRAATRTDSLPLEPSEGSSNAEADMVEPAVTPSTLQASVPETVESPPLPELLETVLQSHQTAFPFSQDADPLSHKEQPLEELEHSKSSAFALETMPQSENLTSEVAVITPISEQEIDNLLLADPFAEEDVHAILPESSIFGQDEDADAKPIVSLTKGTDVPEMQSVQTVPASPSRRRVLKQVLLISVIVALITSAFWAVAVFTFSGRLLPSQKMIRAVSTGIKTTPRRQPQAIAIQVAQPAGDVTSVPTAQLPKSTLTPIPRLTPISTPKPTSTATPNTSYEAEAANNTNNGIISEKWGSRAKERPWRIIAASKLLGRKSRRFEYSVAKRT